MYNICLSSEIYQLDPKDLMILEDSGLRADGIECTDSVIVLIGDDKKGIKDTLLRGRFEIESAISEQVPFIPVRIAFVPRTKKYDFISPLVRKLRYKYKSFSSNIYHTDPLDIRRLKIERSFRTRENAYTFSKKAYRMCSTKRNEMYENLFCSMKEKGFDDRFPIDIMLCRSLGVQDTVDQGHHRMSVAIDCKLERIAIRFGAAGSAPRFLQPLFKLIARISLFYKH